MTESSNSLFLNTREKVFNIVSDQLEKNLGDLEEKTRFEEDLGVDSLDVSDVVMMIEDEFDLAFPSEEFANLKTVGDLVRFVQEHLK